MQNSVKLMLMIVLVIGLVTTVNAAPPFLQQGSFDNGLSVRVAIPDTIKQNQNFDFHIHIFNKSNGAPINSLTSCYLHIYNTNGTHLYQGETDTPDGNFDYSWLLNAGNFTNVGTYQYVTQCNNTYSQGGFTAGSFNVNPSGFSLETEDAITNSTAILLFFGIAIFFLIFAKTTEEGGVKLFLNVIGYLILIFAVGGSYILLQTTQSGLLGISKAMLFMIGIIFIVIMYYIFINLTRTSIAMFNARKGFGDLDNPATF